MGQSTSWTGADFVQLLRHLDSGCIVEMVYLGVFSFIFDS